MNFVKNIFAMEIFFHILFKVVVISKEFSSRLWSSDFRLGLELWTWIVTIHIKSHLDCVDWCWRITKETRHLTGVRSSPSIG